MANIPLHQDNFNSDIGRPGTCRCSCADASFTPSIPCVHPQVCVAYCLQTYPARCTLMNTLGCCGSLCQYFQSRTLENRRCSCSCGGQQFFDPLDTCISSELCLTRCLENFPRVCVPLVTQACCGQDCTSDSKSLANMCACRCRENTYYPSLQCDDAQSCLSTCMTVRKKHI